MSETPKIRCPKCGSWVPANYLICPYCGANLTETRVKLVAETRSLKEWFKTIYLAIKTLNISYIKELLLVPVPGLYIFYAMLMAYALSVPMFGAGPYRIIGFLITRIFRLVFVMVFSDIYLRIITARRVEDRDIRSEVQGLASLRLFIIAIIYALAGVSNVYLVFTTIAAVYTIAAIFRIVQIRAGWGYAIVPVIALVGFFVFVIIRFLVMSSNDPMDIRELVRKYALLNAVQHEGKASKGAVMKLIMGKHPELRPRAREILKIVEEVIKEVNAMSIEEQKKALGLEEIPEDRREIEQREGLPPLPNAEKHKVVMRMAPYPSGPLHIGNARMAILNDEYVKMYEGKLLLVYDDTIGGGGKEILPEAYDRIREDLDRLGVEYHEIWFKSDRVPIYIEYARKLLEMGKAYVCHCTTEEFKKYREAGKPCPHRNRSIEENLEEFEKMLEGYYGPGEAVVRLKTPLDHPNPAVRDHVLLKIADKPHPRVGDRYRVWPVMDFSWAIDEVLLGITHVLRGADLVKEDIVEQLVREALGWKPNIQFIHFGKISVEDVTSDSRISKAVLSKTRIKRLIGEGVLRGWDDPRTWTIRSLRERGILSETIRHVIVSLGIKGSNAIVTPKMVYAKNRELVDPKAPRLFFVDDPVEVKIPLDKPEVVRIPKHPQADMGYREILLRPRNGYVEIYISRNDYEEFLNGYVRLKLWMNIDHGKPAGRDSSRAKKHKARVIHRVPKEYSIRGYLMLEDASIVEGYFEQAASRHIGDIVQLERLYFARIRGFVNGLLEARVAHR